MDRRRLPSGSMHTCSTKPTIWPRWRWKKRLGPIWVQHPDLFSCRSKGGHANSLPPLARRGAGAVERGGLENRCPLCGGPRVRIPPSPPFHHFLLSQPVSYASTSLIFSGMSWFPLYPGISYYLTINGGMKWGTWERFPHLSPDPGG